jgi:hypothetical protein
MQRIIARLDRIPTYAVKNWAAALAVNAITLCALYGLGVL